MKAKIIPVLIANLFAATAASAADDAATFGGSVSLGLRGTYVNAKDEAQLQHFRDLGTGLMGGFDVGGKSNNNYMNLFGENIGRDDQYIDLRGGQYGNFKYQLYNDNVPNNLNFSSRTPYSGVGSSVLRGPNYFATNPRAPDPSTWNTFDYSVKRETYGGNVELTFNSPWFVRFDAREVRKDGLTPVTGGTTVFEVPAPVNYKTTDWSVEGGYASKRGQFTASYLQSKFSNGTDNMQFTNPSVGVPSVGGNPTAAFIGAPGFQGGLDNITLPSDNKMEKFALTGVLRQLPMNSTLSGRFNYNKQTNSLPVWQTQLVAQSTTVGGVTTTTGAAPAGVASTNNFNGDVKSTSAALALTSSLTKELDSKVFWNWYERQNRSTRITYYQQTLASNGTVNGITQFIPPYGYGLDYKKNNLGFDLSYRLAQAQKLLGGFDYTKTERNRDDFTNTKDDRFWIEYRNSMLDNLTGRAKYQYLKRRSDNVATEDPALHPDNDTALVEHVFARFDVANVDQNLFKLVLDSTFDAVPTLDLGLEAIYKKNDYKDIQLGRTQDLRNEYVLSAGWGDAAKFRVTAFADWEQVKYDGARRYIPRQAGAGVSQNYNPAVPFSQAAAGVTNPYSQDSYNWWSSNKDQNYAIGLGADWPVSERLAFKASYIYSHTSGLAEFTSVNNLGTPTNVPGSNLANFDNTTRHQLNLRGKYVVNKSWEIQGGYAYERYSVGDDAYKGYSYTLYNGLASTGYLSGAGAFPDYTAHIYWLMGTLKF
jgi:hypothetical protein